MTNQNIIRLDEAENHAISEREQQVLDDSRKKLLSELRCITGMPDVISQLNPDTVYQLVLKPEGAVLYGDAQGHLKGVFYKDGKIVEHARLREVQPSMLKAAKAVGAQILLVSIAMQLNRIEAQLSRLMQELHSDRLAIIAGGMSLLDQVFLMKEPASRKHLVLDALTELTIGFEKNHASLQRQIDDMPDTTLSFFDNWIGNQAELARKKHQLAMESFGACLQAVQGMARCHLFLDEQEAALQLVNNSLARLEAAGVAKACQRARLVPATSGQFPETGWQQFIDYRKTVDAKQMPGLASNLSGEMVLQLKASQLLEKNHEAL